MDWLEGKVEKAHLMRVSINSRCDIPALEEYLESTETISVDEEFADDREPVRVVYSHPLDENNEEVLVSISYDRKNSFLQDVSVETRATNIGQIRDEVVSTMRSFCDNEK